MTYKKNIRKLLTTASALGMIAIGANEASAAPVVRTTQGGGAAVFSTGVNLAGGAGGAMLTGEYLKLDVAQAITADSGANLVIPAIGIANGINPGTMTLSVSDYTIGSISSDDSANPLGGPMEIAFGGAGRTLTLSGTGAAAGVFTTAIAANTYDGLGTVNFVNNASTVNITATGATFANQFDSTVGVNGTLTATGANNIFTGNIGATNALARINVNANTTFKSATLRATNTRIANGATMTIDSTPGTIGAGGIAAGAIDGAAAPGDGTLKFQGTSAITWVGAIGGGNAIGELDINMTGVGVAANSTITGAVTVAGDITVVNTNASTATFTGAVITTAGSAGNFDASNAVGRVNLVGNHSIDGTVTTGTGLFETTGAGAGNLAVINSANEDDAITIGAGGASIGGTTTVTRGDIKVSNTTAAAAFTGAVTTNANNGGSFDASASTQAVTLAGGGAIDGTFKSGAGSFTSGAALGVTNHGGTVADDAMIIGAGGSGGGNINTITVAKGNLLINATNGNATVFNNGVTITNGNFTTGAGLTSITTAGALTLTAAGSKVVVGTGGLNSARAITFTNGGQIDLAGNRLQLSTADAIVTGDIVSSVAGAGTLNLGYAGAGNNAVANMQITGNIGTAKSSIGAINVTAAGGGLAGAAAVATIGGAGTTTSIVNATTTTITSNDYLGVNSTAHPITYNGTIDGTAGAGGLKNLGNNTITYNGAIGSLTGLGQIYSNAGSVVYNDTVRATTISVLHNNVAYSSTFTKAVTGNVVFATANDTAVFYGNVTGDISGAGNGQGVVTFGNGTAGTNIVVTGGVGNNGRLNKLNIDVNGGTFGTTGVLASNNTNFNTDGTINVGAGSSLGAVTATKAGDGKLNVTAAHTLTGDYGTQAVNLGGIQVASGITLTTGNFNIFAPITGAGAVIDATAANAKTFLDVGASGSNVASFTTGAAAATAGKIFANTITVGAGGLTASGFNGTTTSLTGTATILDGGSIGVANSAGAGAGTVTTQGAATLGAIGSTGTIAALNISGAALTKVVNATGNITATAINQNGSTLQLAGPTTMTGTYTVGAASAIDASKGALTINGPAAQINNALTLKAAYVDGSSNIITAANAPVLGAAGVINITFVSGSPKDGAVLNVFGTAANAVLPVTNGTAANVVYLVNPDATGFVTGITYNPAAVTDKQGKVIAAAGTFTVNAKVTDASFAANSQDANVKATSAILASLYGNATGEAQTMLDNFGNMNAANRAQATADFATHDNNITSTAVAASAATTAAQAAAGAVANIAGARLVTTADAAGGVAAGDSAERFGAWVQVIGGKGTQKQRKGTSGFTSTMMGGTLGADTMISENTTIGMLVSDIANTAKLKDASSAGGKIKSNTWMFGLYGNYDIGATDFFVQGNVTVGQTAVDSKTRRTVAQVNNAAVVQTARGKYDILGVGAELVGGYKFKFENSYVAPTVGVRYNYFGDTSYTETGLTVGNQTIKTKATSVVSGLAGVRFGAELDMDGTTVKPEVHGNLSYAFNTPSSKTSFKINGAQNSFNYTGPKASRFGANFGASVMADADGFEYGVGYDANISDKYLAHQGSLKLKVKF